MRLCAWLLLLLICTGPVVAATNSAPIAETSPVANVAAPNVTVAAPTFPKGLSVQLERGWKDFGYDLFVSFAGFLFNLGLLLLGSLWIGKRIEKYKSRETLRVEMSKESAREMDRLSRLLCDLEYGIEMKAEKLRKFDEDEEKSGEEHNHSAWVKLYRELSWPLEDKKEKVSKEIEAARFWLGPKGFTRFMAHYELLEQYDGLLEIRKWTEAKELWRKIDARRPYVSDIIDES